MSTIAQGLRTPIGASPWMRELATVVNTELLRREATALGTRLDGTTWHLRFKAALSAPWVQVHVQSTEVGEGGVTYDAGTFRTSTQVDCRADLVQDVSVTGLLLDHRYVIFLIPVQYDGADLKVLYDGEGGRPDDMTFTTFPAATALPGEEALVALRYDDVPGASPDPIAYKGTAVPGAAEGSAIWSVQRITFVAGTEDITIEWADGDSDPDNTWTGRAGFSYS